MGMFIFVLSIIVLYFLILYFDLVIPKKGKDVAHPCFCFLSGNTKVHFDYIADHVPEIEAIDQSEHLEIGINIENLHKHYNSDSVWSRLRCDAGNEVHAVRDVTL